MCYKLVSKVFILLGVKGRCLRWGRTARGRNVVGFVRKILAILFVTTLILVGVAALMDPTIRYPILGVSFARDLQAIKGSDPLTVMLSVESGLEMLPEEDLDEEPAVQDSYNLLMVLREEVQPQTKSATAVYAVEEMESEQWAWKEAKLKELKARTDFTSHGIAQAPSVSVPKKSIMATNEVWTPLILSLWPKLPEGMQKAGATWQEQVPFEAEEPLTGKAVKVNYNLVYKLDKFINTEKGILANLIVLGSIDEGTDVSDTVDVRGTFKGYILLEPESGRVYGGEYRIEERFMIKQPDLPVLRRTTYQGARFWRPMFYKMSQQKLKGEDAAPTSPEESGGAHKQEATPSEAATP